MEYLLNRVFDGGRILPLHLRNMNTVRGKLAIKQEHDGLRNRTTVVARLHLPTSAAGIVPPLYDATLVDSNGSRWILAGYERVTSGVLRDEYLLGQSWLLEPAPLEDLRKAEMEWQRLAELVETIKAAHSEALPPAT